MTLCSLGEKNKSVVMGDIQLQWPTHHDLDIRAAPILVSVSVLGRCCCFHEVSESAIILLQIPILITCENKITFVCTCLFY